MATRDKMAVGEWYHCFTRGVDKRTVFEDTRDYERFLVHMYLGKGDRNIRISDLSDTRLLPVLANDSLERGGPLVEIGAYTLMPNHVHFLLKEIRDGGIAKFMQKIFTGYTMYFNNKYDRTGALFSGTFKSKNIVDDRYLKQVIPYILLNSAELFEPGWKTNITSLFTLEQSLLSYPYSSLPDFFGSDRPQSLITSHSLETYYDQKPTLFDMLKNAQEYCLEHSPQV